MELTEKKCVPCEGGTETLKKDEIESYSKLLTSPWDVITHDLIEGQDGKISKTFTFKDFVETMIFVNKVADVAEDEGHHPDMHVYYGKVEIELWTHAIGGLSENDFIMAAKINQVS